MSRTGKIQRSFGEVLKEALEASRVSREEFEDMMAVRLQENPEEAINAGVVPTVNMVKIMTSILKPDRALERELFRSLAPLLASDETKGFTELSRACRYAVGLELRDAGERLNRRIKNKEYDPAMRIALYEIGALFPSAEEGEALAEIYAIPETEHSIFTSKVSNTLRSNLQVVDENYVADSRPNEEDIMLAERMIDEEDAKHEEFIVDAAAEILQKVKDEKSKKDE